MDFITEIRCINRTGHIPMSIFPSFDAMMGVIQRFLPFFPGKCLEYINTIEIKILTGAKMQTLQKKNEGRGITFTNDLYSRVTTIADFYKIKSSQWIRFLIADQALKEIREN